MTSPRAVLAVDGAADAEALAHDLAVTALDVARRFASGATLWIVAPSLRFHAQHVAVEFIHPVIVGTRSLPAACVDGPNPVGTLRSQSRPGDLLLVIGDDGSLADLVTRSAAWGLVSVWLSTGEGPATPDADHVVKVSGDDRAAEIVLTYHLLWELTHLALEHPGLLDPSPGGEPGRACITCSDQARLGEVRQVHSPDRIEIVVDGDRAMVDGSLVGSLAPGDLVLIHAGVVLTKVDQP